MKPKGLFVRGNVWWYRRQIGGVVHRVSTGVEVERHERTASNGRHKKGSPKPPPESLTQSLPKSDEKAIEWIQALRLSKEPESGPLTVKQYAEGYLELKSGLRSIRPLKINLGHFTRKFGARILTDGALSWDEIEKWRDELLKTRAPRTVNKVLNDSSTLMRRAVKEFSVPRPGRTWKLTVNPFESVERLGVVKLDVTISPEMEREFLAHDLCPAWLRVLVPFARESLMRESELCELETSWLRWDMGEHGAIRLPASQVKSGRIRIQRGREAQDEYVYLTRTAAEIVKSQPAYFHKRVFSGPRNRVLKPQTIINTWRAVRDALQWPKKATFHALRRTGATERAMRGATVAELMEAGRWSDIRMAQYYVDWAAKRKTQAPAKERQERVG